MKNVAEITGAMYYTLQVKITNLESCIRSQQGKMTNLQNSNYKGKSLNWKGRNTTILKQMVSFRTK